MVQPMWMLLHRRAKLSSNNLFLILSTPQHFLLEKKTSHKALYITGSRDGNVVDEGY